jgi:hypothetical protein
MYIKLKENKKMPLIIYCFFMIFLKVMIKEMMTEHT